MGTYFFEEWKYVFHKESATPNMLMAKKTFSFPLAKTNVEITFSVINNLRTFMPRLLCAETQRSEICVYLTCLLLDWKLC